MFSAAFAALLDVDNSNLLASPQRGRTQSWAGLALGQWGYFGGWDIAQGQYMAWQGAGLSSSPMDAWQGVADCLQYLADSLQPILAPL